MKKGSRLPAALPSIRVVRSQRVILDSDLARLYGVTTSRLNQQFRRNRNRFPADFAFSLTPSEATSMLSQIVTASHKRNRGKPPIAYTEHGAVMAANILRSARAIAMSIELEELETRVIGRLDRHDHEIEILFRIMATLIEKDGEKAPGRRRVGSA